MKLDANQIIAHLESLKYLPSLSESQRWWPKYLFHFTDVKNAARILNTGFFESRNRLIENGNLPVDIADASVLANTDADVFDHVRFYFRPLTNMQYQNEGIIVGNQRPHCPVPVVFLMDAKRIVSKEDTKFSNGNLGASGVLRGNDYQFFSSIPFENVYHNIAYPSRKVKFNRHAEVIVPNELTTDYVKTVWCRSQAEYRTLMELINYEVIESFSTKIGVAQKFPLFFKKRFYVENVTLTEHKATFSFNKHCSICGPFRSRIEVSKIGDHQSSPYFWEDDSFTFSGDFVLNVQNIPFNKEYLIKLFLDGNLVFQDKYIDFSDLF